MLYTLGHSTHPADYFASTCRRAGIETVIDVRSHPTSKWPWYHGNAMAQWLPKAELSYQWWPELGGWSEAHVGLKQWADERGVNLGAYARGFFPKQRIAGERMLQDGPSWTNQGLYDYSWFLALPQTLKAARRLGKIPNAVIVCAEAQWYRCHRSMIADLMLYQGRKIGHLSPRKTIPPQVVDHGDVIGDRLERYHPGIVAAWDEATAW